MIVIIGEHLPERIKGVLKIWLLEVKPSVFVGDINQVIETRLLKFLKNYMTSNTDMMIIRNSDKNTTQGFKIDYPYNTKDKLVNISGLQVIQKHP